MKWNRRVLAPLFLRRGWRRARRWILTHPHFHTVYHKGYNNAFPNVPHDALRAERILAFLASEGLVARCDMHRPKPVSLKALRRVHTEEYLDSVETQEALTSIMGYAVPATQADRILDLQRLMTGGSLLAVDLALDKGFAVNLGGGFHHALADKGGGFCAFNDIALAVAKARHDGFEGRVLVVDLDLHDGDGTRAIFADDESVHTFSIHARHWGPPDARESTSIELPGEVDDATYITALAAHLPAVFDRFKPALVIYLAGCDPAQEDRMGDWRITPVGMLRRDLFVTQLRARYRAALAVLLAGGYSQESWRYTARFLSDPAGRRGPIEPPTTEEMTIKRYRYISRLLDPAELSGDDPRAENFGLTAEDLLPPGAGFQKPTRLLGFYTRHGVELVMERAGIFDRLRNLGFEQPTILFELEDPAGETVRVFGDPEHKEVLMELRLRRDRRTVPGMELLSVEWMLLQNPRATLHRQLLPGQQYPGLGMLKDVVALLAAACERLHLDGLSFVPSQYHIAVQWQGHLAFMHPEARARFRALQVFFADIPIGDASRALANGRVVNTETNEVVTWTPAPMVAPISRQLRRVVKLNEDEPPEEISLRLEASPDR